MCNAVKPFCQHTTHIATIYVHVAEPSVLTYLTRIYVHVAVWAEPSVLTYLTRIYVHVAVWAEVRTSIVVCITQRHLLFYNFNINVFHMETREQTTTLQTNSRAIRCWHGYLSAPPPPQPYYGPFSGTIRVSWCQKRTSGLYDAREDNRGRRTDHPAGRHSIRTNQCPPPPSSHILYAICLQRGANDLHMVQLIPLSPRLLLLY